MSNAYTATALLASLKRRGLLPSTTSAFSASDYLKFVDEEIQTFIVPLLLDVREEYLVSTEDITLDSSNSYFIPERAIAGGLRDASIVDSSGSVFQLARYEPDQLSAFTNSAGNASGFYVQGNSLVLVPPQASGTLRLSYFCRPNRIVATTEVAEVDSIVGNVVTFVEEIPATFTTDAEYDFIKAKPGFDSLDIDCTASAIGLDLDSLTFSSTPPSDLAAGDFVCLAQESPIPQVPVELHALIAQRVAATVLSALGDDKADRAYKVAEEMEQRARKVLSPRVQGTRRVIVNRFGVGMNGRFRRGY